MDDYWRSNFGLEVLQFVSKVGNMFDLILDLKSVGYLKQQESPQALYDKILEEDFITRYIPKGMLGNLKLSLGTREFAPTIQAFYHQYLTMFNSQYSDCDNWVDYGGNQICSMENITSIATWKQY